ncbi:MULTISPECIES: C40 family peptidase [unclassified Frankia]|uniref:C40 family peptidase n=1 Tax=unclassified Frankia TaxID=2632575 RepID=UPI001EF59841|nr:MULTISPECIES: C40 family peptidase [unclassified Frankia]
MSTFCLAGVREGRALLPRGVTRLPADGEQAGRGRHRDQAPMSADGDELTPWRVRLSPQTRRVATIAAVTTGTLAASTAGFAATMPGTGASVALEPVTAAAATVDSAAMVGGGAHGATLTASTTGLAGKIGNPDPTFTSVSIVADQTTVAPNAPVVFTVRAMEVGTGRPVTNQRVRIAVANGPQWTTTAQLQTNSTGTATISTRLLSTTTLTAVFDGTNVLRPSLAGATTVTVRSPTGPAGALGGLAAGGAATAVPGSSIGAKAVYLASLQRGKPYVYGAEGPYAFDCSGLVQYVFKQLGRSLPRTAQQQFAASLRVPQAGKQPGDLIFFGSPSNITHVAIYAGNGYVWSAPETGRTVSLVPIWTSTYYVGRVM